MEDVRYSGKIRLSYGSILMEREWPYIIVDFVLISRHRYDRLVAPTKSAMEDKLPKRFEILDDDGLARPGERVDPDDVYVNKQSPRDIVSNTLSINPSQVEYRNTPLTYKTKVSGYIDKVSWVAILDKNRDLAYI
jgi:DNA-directed RNA polymerase beta subunit